MKTIKNLALILGLCSLLVQPAFADDDDDEVNPNPDSVIVSLDAVPKRVLDTALQAKTGIYFTRAVKQLLDDDTFYYVMYGTRVNSFWKIRVREDGELISVQEEGEPPPSLGRD